MSYFCVTWLTSNRLILTFSIRRVHCFNLTPNIAAGRELLQPPAKERLYSATEIAEEAGVSANLVGRIANQYGIKTPEYGEYVLDKSPYSDKQVSTFRYNARGKAKLLELLGLQTEELLQH